MRGELEFCGGPLMRLRCAKKICCYVSRYTPGRVAAAERRMDRTASARGARAYADALIRYLGPEGRARWLARRGKLASALELLVSTPEEEWAGDPLALLEAGR